MSWIRKYYCVDCKGRKDTSSHSKKPHFEEETLWEYPIIQEQLVRVLTRAYARSLSQLPIFHSLPPTTKRKPRIYSINKETSAAPSLEDIMLYSLQSIDTPWEEISEDPLSEGNPWPDLGNPNKESLKET